jgi:hypothetical protein
MNVDDIDKETDKFCGKLLAEIAHLNPRLSKSVTQRVLKCPAFRENKKLRKAAKVVVFFRENPDLYEEAAKKLRHLPEFISPISNPKISTFYENVYKMFSIEPVSGSVESKYEN